MYWLVVVSSVDMNTFSFRQEWMNSTLLTTYLLSFWFSCTQRCTILSWWWDATSGAKFPRKSIEFRAMWSCEDPKGPSGWGQRWLRWCLSWSKGSQEFILVTVQSYHSSSLTVEQPPLASCPLPVSLYVTLQFPFLHNNIMTNWACHWAIYHCLTSHPPLPSALSPAPSCRDSLVVLFPTDGS